MVSEIVKADSPLELRDFLYLELERLRKRNLEMNDQRSQLFLFFWQADSPLIYSLYEIEVPKPLPPPQNAEMNNPRILHPVIQFESGMYPEGMCCVQLGSELYFFGGEFYVDEPNIRIFDRVFLPRDVYVFYFTLYNEHRDLLLRLNENLLLKTVPMNSGKASPQAFVADEKIYVMGSTFPGLDNESFSYFEVYDPETAMWTILPNPPIRDVNTRWVGNTVVGRKAVLVALQLGEERLYCFDLDTSHWTNRVSIPDFPAGNFFSGKTEFVEDTLYGCYFNTIGAIAPLLNNGEEAPLVNNGEEEEEVQQMVRLLNNHRLHLVSEEMGMDAIFNVPRQLRSSSSLLHLGNRYFCYVRAGTSPLEPTLSRFISIIIFQAPVFNENAIATGFFRANFVYSKHCQFLLPYSDLFIAATLLARFLRQQWIRKFSDNNGCKKVEIGSFTVKL